MISIRRSARLLRACGSCVRGSQVVFRSVSTLPNNPHIYIFPTPKGQVLSLLPTNPPTPELALGTTTAIPPTPASFTENPGFVRLLQSVLRKHVDYDPTVTASAKSYASPGGSSIFSARKRRGIAVSPDGSGAGGANTQGGMGGGGVGGYIHVFDLRNPPAYGRIPDPENIFGSVVVNGEGNIQKGGYEECGAYRVVTNEGVLGLSDYLRAKLVEKLEEEERILRAHG